MAAEQSFRSRIATFWGLGTGGVDHVFFFGTGTDEAFARPRGRCRQSWVGTVGAELPLGLMS